MRISVIMALAVLGTNIYASDAGRRALAEELMEAMNMRANIENGFEMVKEMIPNQMAQMGQTSNTDAAGTQCGNACKIRASLNISQTYSFCALALPVNRGVGLSWQVCALRFNRYRAAMISGAGLDSLQGFRGNRRSK